MTIRTTSLHQPLTLVEIAETPETLTITQTKAPALRDLRNLWMTWWPMLFLLCAMIFVSSAFILPSVLISLVFGSLLLRSLRGLVGRATSVFDKSRNILARDGQPLGSLGEICRIKSQVNKGQGRNPIFRIMVEIPEGRKIAIATTHFIPAPGEYRVPRAPYGPTSRFPYMTCWEDWDRQDMVPFLDPEIAEIERRITQFLGK